MLPERLVPEFVRKLEDAAVRSGRFTVEEIYAKWKEYSKTCSDYDQSPVWGEFTEWYRKDLEPVGEVV